MFVQIVVSSFKYHIYKCYKMIHCLCLISAISYMIKHSFFNYFTPNKWLNKRWSRKQANAMRTPRKETHHQDYSYSFIQIYITRKQSILGKGLQIPCMDSYWEVASEPSERPCMFNYGHILWWKLGTRSNWRFSKEDDPRHQEYGPRIHLRSIRQVWITKYGRCCTKTSGRCHTFRQIRRQWHTTGHQRRN